MVRGGSAAARLLGAHNLGFYKATETQRMVRYFDEDASRSAVRLAYAEATQ